MKKILVALMSMVCSVCAWAHNFELDGIYYNILNDKNNEVEVTYKGSAAFTVRNEYIDTIVIPSTVTYKGNVYHVTKIGHNAFRYSESLKALTIPSSIIEIGHGAFVHCSALGSITVEEGNPIYNSQDACNAIIETSTNTLIVGCKNTIIPSTVTKIGEWAFAGCHYIENINFQDTIPLDVIRYYQDDTKPTSLTIPNTVTKIDEYAFFNCLYLRFVTIPEGVKTIGNSAFASCYNLKYVSIPSSVTAIGEYSFSDCSALRTLTLSEGLKIIDYRAFKNCSSLKSVAIPSSVETIEWCAFKGCKSLEIVAILGDSEIGNRAFPSRTKIFWSGNRD